MNVAQREQHEARLKATAALLSEGVPEHEAAKRLAAEHDVTERTARGWVAKVRKRKDAPPPKPKRKRKRKPSRRAARPARPRPQPRPVDGLGEQPSPHDFARLGPPPIDDPLESSAYMHKALTVSFWHVLCDSALDPKEKRKEMREISRSAQGCMPHQRLYEVERLVKEDRAELDGPGGPELEVAPAKQSGAPGAASKRGRPPRRKV